MSISALEGNTNFLKAGIDGTLAYVLNFALVGRFTLGLTNSCLLSVASEAGDFRRKVFFTGYGFGLNGGDTRVVLLRNF